MKPARCFLHSPSQLARICCIILAEMILFDIPCRAQFRLNDLERQKQIGYIKSDTLPIEIKILPELVNTAYSEYNAILFEDSSFYFSSLRPESEEDNDNYFSPFWSTRIYQSLLTIGGYSQPKPLPRTINDDQYYNCNFTFNEARTLLIFSRCERETGKELQCTLWSSENQNGHWSKAKQLNRRINLPGSSTTQPFWVDYNDYSVMYFVSNRPKGYGDFDIWYSVYKNDHFEDPINAGSLVNTKDNEITPFYDKKEQRLYFSSDGTHLTIGGYDIFYTTGSMSQWEKPNNIGVPINSEANDFYLSVNKNNRDGYFVSNRPKTDDGDADTCCSDIYHFHLLDNEDTTAQTDTVAADTLNPSEQIVLLLPITLYFHNDEPDPRTTQTTTLQNYQNTLANFVALKSTYKTEYAKGLKGDEAQRAAQAIERFFSDSVENGFRKLEEFSAYLLQDLTAGHTVQIEVCGFASPLHKSDYNLKLSSRRIASFVNYLKSYRDGIFVPYFNAGKIRIEDKPEGSALARKDVSDNVNDQRNSVYSIAASRERKIQVTRYEIIR